MRLKVAIIDLIVHSHSQTIYSRLLAPTLYSIMPQVVAVWAEKLGHEVYYDTFTGSENLLRIPEDTDVLFISSFTKGAYLAYSLSNYYRKRGVITVLGGPHARAYPEDALHYFDYVFGLTDERLIQEFFSAMQPSNREGIYLSAAGQPKLLPGARERWKFICRTLEKSKIRGQVGIIGSLGCPYTCNFCVDALVKYQPLPYEQIIEDLRFIQQQSQYNFVGWYDPNFAVRFDDYMRIIEDSVSGGKLRFLAESSLSLLSEDHVKRLKKNNFYALLPGVESWFDYNDKAKQSYRVGQEKMEAISEQLRMITSLIPLVQVNFVIGGDSDSGEEPFELTKRFVDRVPQMHPSYNLLTLFGNSSPLGVSLKETNRVVKTPYPFQDIWCPNIIPKNYSIVELLDHYVKLAQYTFSPKKTAKRFFIRKGYSRWLFLAREMAWLRWIPYYKRLRSQIAYDRKARLFFSGQSDEVPEFMCRQIKADLGKYYFILPDTIKQRLNS